MRLVTDAAPAQAAEAEIAQGVDVDRSLLPLMDRLTGP